MSLGAVATGSINAQLPAIAAAQVEFLLALAEMAPRPRFGDVEVEDLGANVWRVSVRLHNDSYMSTHCAMASETRQPPIAVRPEVEPERILGGRKLERVSSLAGSGGTTKLEWLIRGAAGDTITIQATHRRYGKLSLDVELGSDNGEAP